MPRCETFNVENAGICDERLDAHGNCPEAINHGDEFDAREEERLAREFDRETDYFARP